MMLLPRFFVLFAALLISGCGGNETASGATTASTTTASTSGGTVTCENDPRAMTYAANLARQGTSGVFQVVIVSADPAPPGRGTDTWTIKVLDAKGTPVDRPTIDVKPFMPDHGHGTSVRPVVTAGSDGTYSVAPLYLFMPGLWQITFNVEAGTASDSVVFSFCIAG